MTAPHHPATAAELYIDRGEAAGEAEAVIVVRCVVGPVRLGARFRQAVCVDAEIDLELTRILFYRHVIDSLDPVCTAMVTLRGTGAIHLRGRNTIQGTNPTPA
ncbi:hypothetical protein ACIA98_08830 [Streptomyces sp. NPDC051366]|uniref:hypothetical protein n=1 Tax=Streptomyces sp. NPDC051366 TaxID=3365652 RepID=UPI0037AE8DFC